MALNACCSGACSNSTAQQPLEHGCQQAAKDQQHCEACGYGAAEVRFTTPPIADLQWPVWICWSQQLGHSNVA